MFDFAIAIEKLGPTPSYSIVPELRERHPDLGFLFDELDEHRYQADQYDGTPKELHEAKEFAEEEIELVNSTLDEVNSRAAQLRDMALILCRMSKIEERDMHQLAEKADELHAYIEKRAAA